MRKLAAIPVAVFALAFGGSYAYHARGDDAAAETKSAAERIVVSVRALSEGEAYLWVMGLDGSDPVQITHAPSDDTTAADGSPAWSPDGESIAFTRQVIDANGQPGFPHVYLVSPDGSDLRQVTRGDAFDIGPAWSPDGERLLIGRSVAETPTDLFTIRLDGSGVTQLTDDPRTHDDLGSFSPDGERIAYTSVAEQEDIWIMSADGSGKKLLLGGNAPDGMPVWSPDGQRIAFVRDGRIGIMNTNGGNVRVLPPRGTHPQWSPDGTRILFTGDPFGIYVMNADGSGVTPVPTEGDAAGASWEPSDE